MNLDKVLYFLWVLHRETRGHEDAIADLYERVLGEHNDVIRLKQFLEDCAFYRETGKSLYQKGRGLLEELYSTPSKTLDILPQLRQAHKAISCEARACEALLRDPLPSSGAITVLKKKDIVTYMRAYQSIASSCVYLMALYAGLEPTKGLSWNDDVGIQEMAYAVNTRFLPALCKVRRPGRSWVIWKKHTGGKSLFGGNCFSLSYENTETLRKQCNALRKEPIGTHAFLNMDAYDTGTCDVPFCWGTGNILSATPANALLFLQNGGTTTLRAPQGGELKRKMPPPLECIRQLSDGAMFCITPENLLLAMNQWHTGHEIEKRRASHQCLLCGAHMEGEKLACPSHFTSELR